MNTVVARVLRVLSGHSAAAMVHALDEHGHELRFEVPAASVQELEPGAVLVLQWSVHRLPDTLAQLPANERATAPSESAARVNEPMSRTPEPAERPLASPASLPLGSTERSAADQGLAVSRPRTATLDLPEPFASLLGLRPGHS